MSFKRFLFYSIIEPISSSLKPSAGYSLYLSSCSFWDWTILSSRVISCIKTSESLRAFSSAKRVS